MSHMHIDEAVQHTLFGPPAKPPEPPKRYEIQIMWTEAGKYRCEKLFIRSASEEEAVTDTKEAFGWWRDDHPGQKGKCTLYECVDRGYEKVWEEKMP